MRLSYIAKRNLVSKPLQTALSAILLAFGVGMVSLMMLAERQMTEQFERNIKDIDFQIKKMYKIIKFDNAIWLKYHLEAQKDTDIDDKLKLVKDNIVRKVEIEYNIPEVKEDINIKNLKIRKDKYKKDRFSFSNYSDFRLNRLIPFIGKEKIVNLRSKLRKIKTISSEIDKDTIIPLLKINKSERWLFLIEDFDFKIDITGEITWLH